MADIYEPYFDYDADGDELAADKLRRIVERLLELASEDDTAAALPRACCATRRPTKSSARPVSGDRSKSTDTINELLARLLEQHPGFDYPPGTKRQGKISVP